MNSVCPGFCYSDLRRDLPEQTREFMAKREEEFAYTAEEGSRQLVYAALGGDDHLRGAFIAELKVADVGKFVASEDGVAAEKAVWVSSLSFECNSNRLTSRQDETLNILSDVDPEVSSIREKYLK